MRYNEKGQEIPDDTPLELPLKLKRAPTIQEMIAMYVQNAFRLQSKMEHGSSDEEEDLDVDDDGDEEVLTPYELHAIAAEYDIAERQQKVLDKLVARRHNKGTVNKDRDKGDGDASDKRSQGDSSGVGSSGKERVASGGEGRPAGERSGGVSKGGEGAAGSDA